MANYVKFKRGTFDEFQPLLTNKTADDDTLYFIYDEKDSSVAELYLGLKKIAGGDVNSDGFLSNLKDIAITAVQNQDLLVYDAQSNQWVNKKIEDIFNEYLPTITQTTVITLNNDNNNDHNVLLTQESETQTFISGDMVIIKDPIANNKYQYTGYVYDGANWIAMDGNYNAENVYFKENFIFTENIGTIIIPESGSYEAPAAGKNLKEFLSSIFAAEKNPDVTNPSATISLGASGTVYEVGSTYTPSYTVNFNDGAYSYGPEPTGVTATYSITDGNETSLQKSDSFASFVIDDNTNYQIIATISYSDGNIPKTNLGNDCTEAQIKAGSCTAKSSIIKGYRKTFYGALNHKNEYDIRSLTSSTQALSKKSTFNIELKNDTQRVVIAYPSSLGDLTKVLDENDANTNIVDGFTKTVAQVKGASVDSSAIDYNIYTMNFAQPYGTTNIFKVTI